MINNHSIVLLLFVLVVSQQNTIIDNLPQYFHPEDEAQYVNYINIMIGKYQESHSLTESLKAVISAERPSILNAPSKVIVLLTSINQQQPTQGKQLSLLGDKLKQLIAKNKDTVAVQNLLNVEWSMVKQEIAKYQAQGMLVNVIAGPEQQISALSAKLSPAQVGSSHRRRLQPVATTDNTYLIKFFFSILFIFIIIGCIGFISSNDGKKDTLLYAKFIADVGTR